MTKGWRQSWSDFIDSLRNGPPRASDERTSVPSPANHDEPRGDQPLEGDSMASGMIDPRAMEVRAHSILPKETPTTEGYALADRRTSNGRSVAIIGTITAFAAILWLLAPYLYSGGFWSPEPPAPNVVATFAGGQITLKDVESHLNILVPSHSRKTPPSPETLLAMVDDLISDHLVLRWASERKPEENEAFRHAVKHIDEELSLESFADQLHDETIPIAESDMRNHYETNKQNFDGRTFAEAREDIRQILVAEREPEFINSYLERLRSNASVTRNFELLNVPPPTQDELERYYRKNLEIFALPRRAIVDEIEVPISKFGNEARQRAIELLLRIRDGASFDEAASLLPGVHLSANREIFEDTRPHGWDGNVFAQAVGEPGSVFRAGDSFFVVRLSKLKPPRTQSLSEVRSVISSAVQQEKEQKWFATNAERTLFTLKGQRYSLKQFYKEYQELSTAARQEYVGASGLRKLASALIDRMLLVTDTYDQLLSAKTKPLAQETRLRLLRQMMEQEEVDDKIVVTEQDIQTYYRENADWMTFPPNARVRYIRIGLGTSDQEALRALDRAHEAYKKLVPGLFGKAIDFATVAQEYSEDSESAAKGGELPGWVGEGQDPLAELVDHPFHEAVLGIDPGEISEPFQLGDSYYIIEVLERRGPQPMSLKEATPLIEKILTERKHRSLTTDLQERLLKDANVVSYPKVLKAYFAQLPQLGEGEDP